jgi:hypothetical protein
MAQLIGLHNPVGKFPAFLIPIFREHDGANALSVQAIDVDGLVQDFDNTIVTLEGIIRTTQLLAINRGDQALWSFGFTVDDFDVDTRPTLARWLRSRLDELIEHPFLYLEAVEFVGDLSRRNQALRAVSPSYRRTPNNKRNLGETLMSFYQKCVPVFVTWWPSLGAKVSWAPRCARSHYIFEDAGPSWSPMMSW